jgi:hypothetical protein
VRARCHLRERRGRQSAGRGRAGFIRSIAHIARTAREDADPREHRGAVLEFVLVPSDPRLIDVEQEDLAVGLDLGRL